MAHRQMHKSVFRAQGGDTIVEVLISIAILGTVLAGAYVTSNRSLLAERTAQEHTEALTLAESQVESLIGVGAPKAPATSIFTAGNYCFNAHGLQSNKCYFPNNNTARSYATDTGGGAYRYKVIVCEQANTCRPAVPDPPAVTIPSTPLTPLTTITFLTYKVLVQWSGLAGDTNSVQLYYRPPPEVQ